MVVVDPPDGLLDVNRRAGAVRIDVFTIFPEYLEGPLDVVAARSGACGRVVSTCGSTTRATHTTDRHRSVDDTPFGGGAGMVMTPEPLFAAVEAVDPPRPLLLLSAAGGASTRRGAGSWRRATGFSLLCGRYEGVDQRVADHLCDGELSVGDFVLAGGEAAALVVIEAVARLVPGVMGNEASGAEESFGDGLLEYPQYTRPAEFRGWAVPEVLRSRRPRAGRPLAAGRGAAPHAGAAARPPRPSSRSRRRGRSPARASSRRRRAAGR